MMITMIHDHDLPPCESLGNKEVSGALMAEIPLLLCSRICRGLGFFKVRAEPIGKV